MKLIVILEVEANLHPDVKSLVQSPEDQIKQDTKRFFELPVQREINCTLIRNMVVTNINREAV
jgi:hypothetical protein